VIDDESLVKTRTNTCLSYTSAVPSYSVVMSSVQIKIVQLLTEQQVFTVLSCVKINQHIIHMLDKTKLKFQITSSCIKFTSILFYTTVGSAKWYAFKFQQ
jgi:hypothetical protein